ncbi:MAG TPA: class I SAM-dependent methyltransferase [Nanoarchaeota archaeon]|nr:class I SAM-dependent methyltransferase [Candidatus Woesearchaeota archaeon]HIH15313.1 class I SAM-dependent methyltransferase [Nanoarchaeota archaeon]HIH59203.1 class I SAM-dependent methyltransferase [Nanoarchaeota archaeon]HII13482.1 class I SAM-dependent methyltransferase [Nanoarchaeota archaeon]HIJ05571.1 class I SAM-dependent methyltransferase [Nanoarchaeota archaeon]
MTSTKNIQERYDRFARVYDFFEYPIERLFFARIRRETLSPLKGKVLEIGVGTGKNLPYYNWKNIEYTGIDFSKNMLEMAKRKNFSKAKMVYMDAQDMDFKENSFDYIVTTFVLCSIPDPVKALKEMQRVIKKEGKIIMVEHVRSKNPLLAFWQDIHNPLTKFFFGSNINRDTKGNIKKSGLHIIKEESLALGDIFRRFEAKKGDEHG